MKSDILVIGGGAAGLMAAYSAARTLVDAGSPAQVTVLEKMPRPGRKIMITGKGRCNFTNVKGWNSFSSHIRTNPNAVKPAFFNFTPEDSLAFFESMGVPVVVERGDRAFPASHHSSDIVDALVLACHGAGVKIETEIEVKEIGGTAPKTHATLGTVRGGTMERSGMVGSSVNETVLGAVASDSGFAVTAVDGRSWTCRKLIIATGGLSYPTTGSTGDGYGFAAAAGHCVTPLFPSLTALVPKAYKTAVDCNSAKLPRHIDRSLPLSELGRSLCGIQLKNIGVQLVVEGSVAQSETGDLDFTDGGIEGPVGFQISRKAVKSLVNGSRVSLILDLKPGVPQEELTARVKELWQEVDKDPRSARLHEKEKCRILLGKLMPWELIPTFRAMNPGITTLERRGRTETKLWVNLPTIAKALKEWKFDIDGFVGWERAVVTAGGVPTEETIAKTLESRKTPGLYLCGEVLDVDADTGGYNLHLAFATGRLAGQSAAKALLSGVKG